MGGAFVPNSYERTAPVKEKLNGVDEKSPPYEDEDEMSREP